MLKYFLSAPSFLARRLGRDDRGATAVEYGLIVALIAAGIIVAVGALGTNIAAVFNSVATTIAGAI
jgi:pilus assembly protein Flp/PilA